MINGGQKARIRRSSNGRIHSPTREKILEKLAEQPSGVSLAWMVQSMDLHENTVRAQLEALLHDGYLSRFRAPAAGRGRPAWIWKIKPETESAFAQLASVLAGQIAAISQDPAHESMQAGMHWGTALAQKEPEIPGPYIIESLDELGFSPIETQVQNELLLQSCPLLSAAEEHPQIVCNVHLGMVRGLLSAQGIESADVELQPFAADQRGCLLRLPGSEPRQG